MRLDKSVKDTTAFLREGVPLIDQETHEKWLVGVDLGKKVTS